MDCAQSRICTQDGRCKLDERQHLCVAESDAACKATPRCKESLCHLSGGSEGRHINLIVAAGSRVKLGLRYESGRAPKDTAGRFRVLSMQGTEVLGGGNLLVRH